MLQTITQSHVKSSWLFHIREIHRYAHMLYVCMYVVVVVCNHTNTVTPILHAREIVDLYHGITHGIVLLNTIKCPTFLSLSYDHSCHQPPKGSSWDFIPRSLLYRRSMLKPTPPLPRKSHSLWTYDIIVMMLSHYLMTPYYHHLLLLAVGLLLIIHSFIIKP